MHKSLFLLLGLWLSLDPLAAEETKTWSQSSLADFEKGTADNVSLRSDGRVELAPRLEEIFEAPSSYLWDLAIDSRGSIYAAAGPEATVYKIAPDGSKTTHFEADAVEIHALAVDAEDNVYAATSPETRIYKIDPSGGSELFYDPDVSYAWDMLFGPDGMLYVATGDRGEIHRVAPSGDGEVFFETGETHVRSLALDAEGRLVAGTDPGGLILRIDLAAGEAEGFVLYQSPKKEITAITAGADGAIYAAGVGTRTVTGAVPATSQVVRPSTNRPATAARGQAGSAAAARAASQPRASSATTALQVRGGSSVVRIAPDGEPREVWSSRTTLVYSLGFDEQDRLLLGTGDRGRLYRLDDERLYSLVHSLASNQLTAIGRDAEGRAVLAASNIGKIYRLGPEPAEEGSLESDLLDAKLFSRWGRLEWDAAPDGAVSIELRSGNLNRTSRNWSPWAEDGAETPGSRYAQWRAVLRADAGEAGAPHLDAVRLHYKSVNRMPRITALELTPANYRFPPLRLTPQLRTLTLRPLGATSPPRKVSKQTPGQTMSGAAGWLGVRWTAEDPNGDRLEARVEIRGEGETAWIPLEDEIGRGNYAWDGAAFADGRYRVRVTVSDEPSNPAEQALESSRISEPFLIDNTAPRIEDLRAEAAGDDSLRLRFTAADDAGRIRAAEYSINGGDWLPALPVSGIFDSDRLMFDFEANAEPADQHVVAVRIYDARDNATAAKAVVR